MSLELLDSRLGLLELVQPARGLMQSSIRYPELFLYETMDVGSKILRACDRDRIFCDQYNMGYVFDVRVLS